jgi:CheY-like chemotaxis protein
MDLARSFISEEKKTNYPQPLILAVEDNDDNLVLITYTLESLGCKLICQKDSSSTLLIAKEYQPDLILMDILLPGLSGIDVVHYLKKESLTCKIPVIAVTALASPEERERILMAGFDDYISKPYMIEDFEALISSFLSKKLNPQSCFDLQ